MSGERAYDRLWEERQGLARECADLRDKVADLERQVAGLKDHIEILDHDRSVLTEELFQATGRDWTEEQSRSWGS